MRGADKIWTTIEGEGFRNNQYEYVQVPFNRQSTQNRVGGTLFQVGQQDRNSRQQGPNS